MPELEEEVTTPEDSAEDSGAEDLGAEDRAKEKTLTQEDVDRIVAKRLKRQEEQFKKQYADFDKFKADSEAFQKIQDEKATDSERWERERERLAKALQDKDEQLSKLQRANLIADLATEKGLPKSMWKRVQGDSEEDIAEDIESLVNDLKGSRPDQGGGKEDAGGGKKKAGRVYGGGGEGEDPDPDIAEIVSKIPRGPQLRVDKPRTYK